MIEEYVENLRINGGVYDKTEVHITLEYPMVEDRKFKSVVMGVECVRAIDDIKIHFDFDRNGYVIQQASIFSWNADDKKCDPDWQEVAFVEAWGREI